MCERVQSSNYFLTLSPDPLGLASVNTLVHGLSGPSDNVTLCRFEEFLKLKWLSEKRFGLEDVR